MLVPGCLRRGLPGPGSARQPAERLRRRRVAARTPLPQDTTPPPESIRAILFPCSLPLAHRSPLPLLIRASGNSLLFQGYNQDAAWRAIFARKSAPEPAKKIPYDGKAISQAAPAIHSADETLPMEVRPTPLASLLAPTAAGPELAAYRGVLTPRKLDAPERETAALVSGVAVHDLGWLRRVAVRGEDRFRWLSGMVTNTVNDLGSERRRMEPGAQRAGAHPGRPARLARGRGARS